MSTPCRPTTLTKRKEWEPQPTSSTAWSMQRQELPEVGARVNVAQERAHVRTSAISKIMNCSPPSVTQSYASTMCSNFNRRCGCESKQWYRLQDRKSRQRLSDRTPLTVGGCRRVRVGRNAHCAGVQERRRGGHADNSGQLAASEARNG
jgi:hypothetical protein